MHVLTLYRRSRKLKFNSHCLKALNSYKKVLKNIIQLEISNIAAMSAFQCDMTILRVLNLAILII